MLVDSITQEALSFDLSLSSLVPGDVRWIYFKICSLQSCKLLLEMGIEEKKLKALNNCCNYLTYKEFEDPEKEGVTKFRLVDAEFCRNRILCATCNILTTSRNRLNFIKVFPKVLEDYPKSRLLFFTFSIKNCRLDNLNATIDKLNKGWRKISLSSFYKKMGAIGYLKTIEITVNEDGTLHPHLHILVLLEDERYFEPGNYISHDEWISIWRKCVRVNYDPAVHVKAVPKIESVKRITEYLFKYVCKPHQLSTGKLLLGIDKQVKGLRLVSTGGVLKEYARMLEEVEDMLGKKDDDITGIRKTFYWDKEEVNYFLREWLTIEY